MADESARLTKNPLGPSGMAVAANIEHLRTKQNLTFAALSEKVGAAGRPIPPLGLRKIVAQTRRVDADDLVALAIALDVSPASLLMPDLPGATKDDMANVTGYPKQARAGVVWAWLTAARPLVDGTGAAFLGSALPDWELQRRWAAMNEAMGLRGRGYGDPIDYDGFELRIDPRREFDGNDQ